MKDFSPVELRELRDKARELERFLKLEFPGRVQKRKSQLIIEDEKPRDVRLKLDKFLHAHNLTSYRVRRRNGMLEFTTVPGRSRGRSVLDQRSRAENTPRYFPGLSAFAATRFKTPYSYFGAKTKRDARKSRPGC